MIIKMKKQERVKIFSLSKYMQKALEKAEYYTDENGIVIAEVPGASGFFSQGDTFEEARENLRDAIEGNVILALQLGLKLPSIKGVEITEIKHAKTVPTKTQRSHKKA